MKNFLYVLAFILVLAWIIGFFSTSIGNIIHIVLAMAVIALIISIYNDEKMLNKFKIKPK